ncbi:MAG: hypothetical protein WC565_07415 [Parcubacteria group bacterium]|jgi:hypothetical protein
MPETYHAEQVELALYIENEGDLYPQKKAIIENMNPQPEHARTLWSSIAANEDPNRPGHAAIYPTPTKPL